MVEKIKMELQICDSENETSIYNSSPSGYKIIRIINGEKTEVELTGRELHLAYDYQEINNHRDDIKLILDELEGDDALNGYTADELFTNADYMADVIPEYTRNKDKYNMEWHAAALDAVNKKLSEV